MFCRQDLRAAGRGGAGPPAADRGGGHEGLLGVVPGGEEAEGDERGAGGLLHQGGQTPLEGGSSGSLGIRLSRTRILSTTLYVLRGRSRRLDVRLAAFRPGT